ncbi:MAG: hypothetical protein EON54_01750 [Alcaligenaceae bacterium]|nr:MAG: hypothetical protein EON54_01750 [Alcaligenaceae bacterium]
MPAAQPENEDADPVGELPIREPFDVFRRLAIDHGLLKPDDLMDQDLIAFAFALVEECAKAADPYGDEEAGGNGGEAIRAILGDGPDV